MVLLLELRGQSAPATAPSDPPPAPFVANRKAAATVPGRPLAELSVRDSIVLGLVEGITEFLPVSSTGHLIIADHALGLEAEEPIHDANGQIVWYKKPSLKHPGGVPMTIKLAADTYIVIIQVGAIAAVVLLYYADLLGIVRGLFGQSAKGLRLLRNLIIAVFPAALLGLLLKDWIDDHLFSVRAVIVSLVSGAVLMFAAESWRKKQGTRPPLEPADLSPKQSLGIGLMQCLALWPGMSRSMVTMVGGYFSGLTPAKAAEFSFLVGLPTLAGAALLKAVSGGAAMVAVFGLPHAIFGGVVAALSAGVAVKWLVSYLSRHGLNIFAIYRIILAIALLFLV
jgi:undecaprenyl-diphosphatase